MRMCGPREGGQGIRTPHEKSQKYRVSKEYLSGFPEKHKATKPASMLSHHQHASETPFQLHFNGVSLAGRWWPAYSGIWILPPLIN